MKIRNGFISNSSSSSFVIRYDKKNMNKCDKCGRSDNTLIKVAELESRTYCSETEIKRLDDESDIVEMEVECSIHGVLHDIILEMGSSGKIEIISQEEY
jgi:hypothetical protein